MAALLFAGAVLDAPPEIAAADDEANLHAHVNTSLDGSSHFSDLGKIQAETVALGRLFTQRFTADLQQDALIFQFIQPESPFPIYPILF